jgi:3-deoxy-manno-octulosonate cytidylyltransferase (CMP-KDO synthetase)
LIDPKVIDAVAGALAERAADILSAGTNMPSAGWKPAALCEMSTAATRIKNPADLDNPNVVKVVVDAAGRALYFSRRTIPYLREGSTRAPRAVEGAPPLIPLVDGASTATREARVLPNPLAAFPFLKHLGIYRYRRETLLRLVKFPVSPLEKAEKLEQLRALENGIAIAVVQVDYDGVSVDTPEDVAKVESILSHR